MIQRLRVVQEGLDDVFDALRTSRSEVGEDEDQFDEGTPLEEEGIALR